MQSISDTLTAAEAHLVDTNSLLRFAERTHPLHPTVRNAVDTLRTNGSPLFCTSQNLVEFWNVATRPAAKNGFGLSLAEADALLKLIEQVFPRLPDTDAIYPNWRNLVVTFGVSGVQVHDARLVAAMQAHNLSRILTFNVSDFARYAPLGIVPVDPTTI